MLWRGIKLDKKDTFGKSDPFLEFHRLVDGGSYQLIHKTEIIENTLNPTWKELKIPVNALAAGDNNRELLIRCYDFDTMNDNDLIGVFMTTPAELIGCATESTSRAFSCINPKKTAKKKYVDSGKIELLHCKVLHRRRGNANA
ncbi:PREDICTED: copine-3-like isoform X2 [Priapulus caudatus]|uniref:Copine-3-like isoform X2 n=1 Tax=Priapulus caudatus TaxID=37621 RepID=A0ABM1ELY8_PRICU|nr:PREDICTED: copine-3-like isoform X2 [Priapulus caudatus]